ncbi:MAG: hypothetical protein MJZ86_03590 [Bacteroidales bacterium]|nr:hypothetical protein [Bacteroidales bacterium]
MDKNCFGKLLDNPNSLTADEWDDLRRERDDFPFCAPLQVLTLMADKMSDVPLWEKRSLPRVALYCQDANLLHDQLQHIARATAPQPKPKETTTKPEMAADFDVLQEINAYQEVSFKTAPKSVILSNFLEKDAGMVPSNEPIDDIPVQELAKKSISTNESLESETLAIILKNQGKYEQSLAMYEKLLVNNPEKSSIFAVQIAELKDRLLQDK